MIKIIGPRDKKEPGTVNTTSHSSAEWATGLSLFNLGPISLYGSHTARIFENAWQFAKLYPEHADTNGLPKNEYWAWAQNGWNATTPFRYRAGKGRKPLCSLWDGFASKVGLFGNFWGKLHFCPKNQFDCIRKGLVIRNHR